MLLALAAHIGTDKARRVLLDIKTVTIPIRARPIRRSRRVDTGLVSSRSAGVQCIRTVDHARLKNGFSSLNKASRNESLMTDALFKLSLQRVPRCIGIVQ